MTYKLETKKPFLDSTSNSLRLAAWSAEFNGLKKITRGCLIEGIFNGGEHRVSRLLFDEGLKFDIVAQRTKDTPISITRDFPLSNGALSVIRFADKLAQSLDQWSIGEDHILWGLTTYGTGKTIMIPNKNWGIRKIILQRKLLEIYPELGRKVQINMNDPLSE